MADPVEHGYYSGLKIHVNSKGTVTWQPNRYQGNHGARYEVKGAEEIVENVLKIKPGGSTVKLTSRAEILYWRDGKPQTLVKMENVPDLEMPPFNLRPDLSPGSIWRGPYDGEKHSFFNGKIWLKTADKRRCYWIDPPNSLLTMLAFHKGEGGHFLITPWKDIIALIQPKPRLPPEIQAQFDLMSEQEKHLLLLKKQSTSMLPLFLGTLEGGFELKINPPEDFSKPLTEDQLSSMKSFLGQFVANSTPSASDNITEKTTHSEESDGTSELYFVDEEFFDDEDFDDDDAMSFLNEDVSSLYAPGAVEQTQQEDGN